MTSYAISVLKIPPGISMAAGCVAALVQVALSAYAGRLSDRIGRKPLILWSRIAMLAVIYLAFLLLNARPTLATLLVVVAVLALLLVLNTVPSVVMLSELFPRRIRATGMSIVYCIGVLVFGGFAQFLATWLISVTGNANALDGSSGRLLSCSRLYRRHLWPKAQHGELRGFTCRPPLKGALELQDSHVPAAR